MCGCERRVSVVVFLIGAFVVFTTGQDACNRETPCTPDEVSPDPEDCRKFYECNNGGNWKRQSCGNNDFDSVTETCVPVGTGTCFSCDAVEVSTDPACERVVPCLIGDVLGNPLDCDSYYECTAVFIWTQIQCPTGQTFDTSSMQCERTVTPGIVCQPACPNWSVPNPTTVTTTTAADTTTTTTAASTIRSTSLTEGIIDSATQEVIDKFHDMMCGIEEYDYCDVSGAYPDPTSCDRFFLCYSNQWKSFPCFGKEFDIMTRACVEGDVTCLPECPELQDTPTMMPTTSTTTPLPTPNPPSTPTTTPITTPITTPTETPTTTVTTLITTTTSSTTTTTSPDTTSTSETTTQSLIETTLEVEQSTAGSEVVSTTKSNGDDGQQTTLSLLTTAEPDVTTKETTVTTKVATTSSAAIEEITEPPRVTTEPMGETTEPAEAETTEPIVDTTVAEVDTTVAETTETTEAEVQTTVAELDTTIAEGETTVAEVDTTVAEVDTTVAEVDTTVAEVDTTVADVETTIAEEETTEPKVESTAGEEHTTEPFDATTQSLNTHKPVQDVVNSTVTVTTAAGEMRTTDAAEMVTTSTPTISTIPMSTTTTTTTVTTMDTSTADLSTTSPSISTPTTSTTTTTAATTTEITIPPTTSTTIITTIVNDDQTTSQIPSTATTNQRVETAPPVTVISTTSEAVEDEAITVSSISGDGIYTDEGQTPTQESVAATSEGSEIVSTAMDIGTTASGDDVMTTAASDELFPTSAVYPETESTTQLSKFSTQEQSTSQSDATNTQSYETTVGEFETTVVVDVTSGVNDTIDGEDDVTTQVADVTAEANQFTTLQDNIVITTQIDDVTDRVTNDTASVEEMTSWGNEVNEATSIAPVITTSFDETSSENADIDTTLETYAITTQTSTTVALTPQTDGITTIPDETTETEDVTTIFDETTETDDVTTMLDKATERENVTTAYDEATTLVVQTSAMTTPNTPMSNSTLSLYLSSTSPLSVTSSAMLTTEAGEASSLEPDSTSAATTNFDVTTETTEATSTMTSFAPITITTTTSTPTPTNMPPVVQYCIEEMSAGVSWRATPEGQTDRNACPNSMQGEATRLCTEDENGNPLWQPAYLGLCVDVIYQVVLTQAVRLQDSNTDMPSSTSTVEQVSNLLNTVVDSGTNIAMGMSAGNLNATVETLEVLVDVNQEASLNFIETSVNTTSNILSPNNRPAWEAVVHEDDSRAVALLNIAEELATGVSEIVEEGDTILLVSPTFVLEVVSVTPEEPSQDLVFSSLAPATDSITIPAETLQQVNAVVQTDEVVIWSTQFSQLSQYLPTKEDEELGSNIIGMTIANLPEGTILDPPIQMTFGLINTSSLEDKQVECVFWHYTSADRGFWDNTGCKVVSLSAQNIECECNHLTNFAVLISPYVGEDTIHQRILSIIGVVGCLLSILGSLVTLCLYAIAWKRVNSQHAIVMLNLCFVLIIANTLFLVGIEKTDHELACTVIAALLHYFYLVAMMLMLADGIYFVLYIVYVFHTKRKRETMLILFTSWTLPAVEVGLSLSITKLEGYGTPQYCWLARENWVILAFIIPVIIIIVVNFFIFVKVLKTAATSKTTENKNRLLSTLWNVMVILPLLGVTWVFGLLSVNEKTVAFQYVFSICNSLQGFFIFLCHCALNKKVREAVAAKFKSPSSSAASIKSAKSVRSDKSKKSNKSDESNKKKSKEDKRKMTEKPIKMTPQINGNAGHMTTDSNKSLPLHHGRSPMLPRLDPNKVAQNRRYRAEQATLLKQRKQSVKSTGLPDNGSEFMTYSPQFIDTFDDRCYTIGPQYIDMGDTKYYDEDDNPEDHIYMEIDNPTFNFRPESNWINFPQPNDRL